MQSRLLLGSAVMEFLKLKALDSDESDTPPRKS